MKHLKKGVDYIIIGLVLLLCLPQSTFANKPISGTAEKGRSIASFLNTDGTLAIPNDFSGSLDLSGFSVSMDECAGPIATSGSSEWGPLGSGLGNWVRSLTIDGMGNVYVGGDFTAAGGVMANHIAKWDGNSWSALGDGLNNTCYALTADGSDIYAGGIFSEADGVVVNNIAKWDGNSWSTLGDGLNNSCFALLADGSDIYAGGIFSEADGVVVNNIAKWDGSSWSALGDGMNGRCEAIATDGSTLYVGGRFTQAGGISANNIAKWDGSNWSALGAGLIGGSPTGCYGIATDGMGNVYVGGPFTQAGEVSANSVAKWDGNNWSTLGTGISGSVVYNVAIDGMGNVYFGGSFNDAGGEPANNIAKWDGSSWNILGSGLSGFCRIIGIDHIGQIYAGGGFIYAGGVPASRVAIYAPVVCDIELSGVTENGESCVGGSNGNITITANCTSCTSIEYSIDGGGTLSADPNFTDLSAGTYDIYIQDAANPSCNATSTVTIEVLSSLPCGLADNGGIGCGGTTSSFDATANTYTLNVLDCAPIFPYTEDQTAFIGSELCGDGEIIVEVTNITGTGYAGIMMRDGDAPDATKVAIGTNTINFIRKELRVIAGYPAYPQQVAASNQVWLRITGTGNSFSAFASPNGVNWFPYINQAVQMGACVKVGMYTYSEKPDSPIASTFGNVSIPGVALALNTPANPAASAQASTLSATPSFSLFPNPSNGEINVNLENYADQNVTIRIFDGLGKEVLHQQIDELSYDPIRLDGSALENGLYHLTIQVGDTRLAKRLVITK